MREFRRLALVFGSLVVVQATVAGVVANEPRGHLPIPLTFVAGRLPAVSVWINGQGPFLFVVDTGGHATMVSTRVAERLGLVPRARYHVDTVAGSTIALAGEAERLAVGGVEWQRPELLWMPLDTLQAIDPRLEGTLGLDLLARQDFVIDYREATLAMVPAGSLGFANLGTKTPLRRMGGRFGVTASVGGTLPISLVLDSAAGELVLFDSPAMRTLSPAPRPAGAVSIAGHTGSRLARSRQLASLEISGTRLRDVLVVDVSDRSGTRVENGLLPTRFFDRVSFAVSEGFVVLERQRSRDSHGNAGEFRSLDVTPPQRGRGGGCSD